MKQTKQQRLRKYLAIAGTAMVSLALLSFLSIVLSTPHSVSAAPLTFTVNSTADGDDATPGNGVCQTSTPGQCTLRAAITEANANSGADTINFNISGAGVHTIQPASALPNITDQVTINGYSQPGSAANTAVAPNPLNGTLLIEVDGSGAGLTAGLVVQADNTLVRGLIINRFQREGIAISADDIQIAGTYIGTDPTGLIARPNLLMGVAQHADGPSVLPLEAYQQQAGILFPEMPMVVSHQILVQMTG